MCSPHWTRMAREPKQPQATVTRTPGGAWEESALPENLLANVSWNRCDTTCSFSYLEIPFRCFRRRLLIATGAGSRETRARSGRSMVCRVSRACSALLIALSLQEARGASRLLKAAQSLPLIRNSCLPLGPVFKVLLQII